MAFSADSAGASTAAMEDPALWRRALICARIGVGSPFPCFAFPPVLLRRAWISRRRGVGMPAGAAVSSTTVSMAEAGGCFFFVADAPALVLSPSTLCTRLASKTWVSSPPSTLPGH